MYILDVESNKDYYLLKNGDSTIMYSKHANTLENLIEALHKMGVKEIEIVGNK